MTNATGGKPWKLESAGKHLFGVRWSRDGRFLYFLSGQGGSKQLWKVPSGGGEPQQLTRRGAYGDFAVESPDGKRLFYLGQGGIWSVPANGGEEREILEFDINPSPLESSPRGIYFVSNASTATGDGNLMFYPFPNGPATAVAGLKTGYGFSVSPDERYLVYTTMVRTGADLMLVNNFR